MRKSRKRNNKTLFLIIILLLAGISLFYYYQPTKVTTSYAVNEQATLNNDAVLYQSLSAKRSIKAPSETSVNVNHYYLVPQNNQQVVYAKLSLNGMDYYTRASNLNLTMTNDINKYIAQLGYPHSQIKQNFLANFAKVSYGTHNGKPRGVVIHDTGNEYSTLNSEVAYMRQNYQSTRIFVHTFIDAQQILNIADPKYMAEGAGPKANPYYLQFEMPHEYTARKFADQLANAAYYTAYSLKENNLPVTKGKADGTGTVWTHQMISDYLGGTDHQDPTAYWTKSAQRLFNSTYNVDDFIELVQAYYNQLSEK